MTLSSTWGVNLRSTLSRIRGLSTSKPNKYDPLNHWLESGLDLEVVRSCHVSKLSQMWTARLGQVLMGFPEAVVVLSSESLTTRATDGRSYLERLQDLLRYVGRIQLVLVCRGAEGAWSVDYVLGPSDGFLSGDVADALPEAEHVLVDVAALRRR